MLKMMLIVTVRVMVIWIEMTMMAKMAMAMLIVVNSMFVMDMTIEDELQILTMWPMTVMLT